MDNEIILTALEGIEQTAKRTTTGNVAHNMASIQWYVQIIRDELSKEPQNLNKQNNGIKNN